MKKGRVDGAKVLAGDFADGIKTWGPYAWWDLFTGKNTDGFEMPDPYRWRDRCTVKNTDVITEGFEKQVRAVTCRLPVRITDGFADVFTDEINPSIMPSAKVNIWPFCRHSPPPFLFLLPNPNPPHLQITSPPSPQKKNLPHLSTTSCISWSFVVTASVFWFTDGFYHFL